MSIKRRFAHPLLTAFTVLAAACGSSSTSSPPDSGPNADTGIHPDAAVHEDAQPHDDAHVTDMDGGTGLDAEPDSGLPPGPGLAGVLLDENGAPVTGVMVLACSQRTCLYGMSDLANGSFFFQIDPPTEIALKTHEAVLANPRQAAVIYPVDIVNGDLVNMGNVYVPLLPAGQHISRMDPQTLSIGDGLELTFNRADLTPAIGEGLNDMAARQIPPAHYPPIAQLSGEQIDAIYALHPFTAKSSSPVAVKAPTTLPANTAVNFRTLNELDGRVSTAAIGHSDGTFVTTDPGQGIDNLTWLVISH